jgi:hypothetical protein
MVGTPEAAQKAQATRLAKQQTAAKSTGFPNGTTVKVNTPRERHYHGRIGTVETHNLGEIGVTFASNTLIWFRADQLVKQNAPA